MKTAVAAMFAGMALASAAGAAVVVNDQFSDGGFTNGADPLDTVWSKVSADNALLSLSPGPNYALLYDNARSNGAGAYPLAKGIVALGQTFDIGERLTLSMDMRITVATPLATSGSNNASNGAAFRIGLGNPIETFAAQFGSGNAPGGSIARYGADVASGTSTGLTIAGGGTIALNDGNTHTFTLTVDRTASNTLLFAARVDATAWTGAYASATNFAYDRILIGQGNVNNLDMAFDNISLAVAPIPEPAGTAVITGAAGLLACRRRKVA